MKLFSLTNKNFKKHWWKFLLIDVLFLAILFFSLVAAKLLINNYLNTMESYYPQILTLQEQLSNNSSSAAMTLINELDKITKVTKLLLFLVLPAIVFLFYSFIGSFEIYLFEKKKSFKNYAKLLVKFLITSLPAYLLAVYLIVKGFDYAVGEPVNKFIGVILFIVLVFLAYLTFIYSLTANMKEYFKMLRKKVILFPFYLITLMFYLISFFVFSAFLITLFSRTPYAIVLFFVSALFLFLLIYSKISLIGYVKSGF